MPQSYVIPVFFTFTELCFNNSGISTHQVNNNLTKTGDQKMFSQRKYNHNYHIHTSVTMIYNNNLPCGNKIVFFVIDYFFL